VATDAETIIKDMLNDAGIGVADPSTTVGWAIFSGPPPQDPANCISIMVAGGLMPNPAWAIDYPSVQVRVRGEVNTYEDTKVKARTIKDLLLGHDPYVHVSGDRVDIFTMIGDLVSMPPDETGRPVFVLNFRLTIEPAAGPGTSRMSL
jgi:hypothetical protein